MEAAFKQTLCEQGDARLKTGASGIQLESRADSEGDE